MSFHPVFEKYLIKTKDLWCDYISLNLPLSDSLLTNYSDQLNWELVSKNKKIDWCPEIIRKFESKWHWSQLTRNKSIYEKINEIKPLISEYSDCWSWKHLSRHRPYLLDEELKKINNSRFKKYNCNVNSHYELLKLRSPEEFSEWIQMPLHHWDSIPWLFRRSYKLDLELLQENIDKVNWKIISSFDHIPFDLIEPFRDYWDWKILSQNTNFITRIDLNFISKYNDYLVWPLLKLTNQIYYSFKNSQINNNIEEVDYYLRRHKYFTESVLDKIKHDYYLWIFINLFYVEKISWSIDLYQKFEDEWKINLKTTANQVFKINWTQENIENVLYIIFN